jgi:hypothetical protein
MNKGVLHLSISPDLIERAKNSNMNLSEEFESWLKIRLNQTNKAANNQDIDKEISKLQMEILNLNNQKDQKVKAEMQDKEELIVIDYQIDDMVKFKDNLEEPDPLRIKGLQFLLKSKFNKDLNPLEARELLINRAKERNLLKSD